MDRDSALERNDRARTLERLTGHGISKTWIRGERRHGRRSSTRQRERRGRSGPSSSGKRVLSMGPGFQRYTLVLLLLTGGAALATTGCSRSGGGGGRSLLASTAAPTTSHIGNVTSGAVGLNPPLLT